MPMRKVSQNLDRWYVVLKAQWRPLVAAIAKKKRQTLTIVIEDALMAWAKVNGLKVEDFISDEE